jgi:hypothetical protein
MQVRAKVATVLAATMAAALVTAVVLNAVASPQHKSTLPQGASPAPENTLTADQRESIAHQLSTMALPKGLSHTSICPQEATPMDACFASNPAQGARSVLNAADETEQFLTSLHIVLTLERSCSQIAGGPLGRGYDCQASGRWNDAAVTAVVFLSDHKVTGLPGIDGMITVLADKPS